MGLEFCTGESSCRVLEVLLTFQDGIKTKPGRSVYEYVFKIADFGLSLFKSATSPAATDMDSYGTRAYGMNTMNNFPCVGQTNTNAGAPETFRFDDSMIQARLDVGKSVDIWSLGCVFSEVATWVVHGWNGLQKYRDQRKRDLENILGLGAGDAFHDGSGVLAAVVDNHVRLKQSNRINGHLTPQIIATLISDMMVESKMRANAKQLYQKAMRMIQRSREIVEAKNRSTIPQLPLSATTLVNEISMTERLFEHSAGNLEALLTKDRLIQANSRRVCSPRAITFLSPINCHISQLTLNLSSL